jgi:hypothetical protein
VIVSAASRERREAAPVAKMIADSDGLESRSMAVRVIIGIVALACVSVCGIMLSLVSTEMVDKVNEKLPEGGQFGALGWYLPKTQRLHREYRRLYPDGRLLLRLRVLISVAIVCLLICAWSIGVFAV